MRTHSLRNLVGIVIAAAAITIYFTLVATRSTPSLQGNAVTTLASSTQMLKVAQTEKFQTDMKFAESNAEAAELVGNRVKLGRIDGADPVVEFNVREGGVIEYLLGKKGDDGKPQRVIYLPQVGDPVGSQFVQWRCYSANWSGVAMTWAHCTYDAAAWELERRHVASLRGAVEKMERDAENSRATYEAERARGDFDRQRAQRLRDAEREREEEERQMARLERETERARIDSERQKRGW